MREPGPSPLRPSEERGAIQERIAALRADAPLSPAENAAILAERARRLAAPRVAGNGGALLELIAFELAGERYAIETRFVIDLLRSAEIALLPGVEPPLLGLVAWRGELLPLLDLHRILGLTTDGAAPSRHFVVLGDDRPAFAVEVDAPLELHDLPRSDVGPTAGNGRDGRRLLEGVTRDALLVLDGADLIRTHSSGANS